MAYQVIFTRRASNDVASYQDNLVKRSSAAAQRWRSRLLQIVLDLESDPYRYPDTDDYTELGIRLREVNFGCYRHIYRVFFSIQVTKVIIHRVRHAAQDQLGPDAF